MSVAREPEPLVPEHDDDVPAPDTDHRIDDVPADPDDPALDDRAAGPVEDPGIDEVDELSADIDALDDDATPGALDDSSSVVESDLDETGVVTAPADGGAHEHAERDTIDDLPDDADGVPST